MYYVIQVAPGAESRTEAWIRSEVETELYKRCFHLERHVRKKIHGEWIDRYEKLLPGYVFVFSDSVNELYKKLQWLPMPVKLLGRDGEWFAALQKSEVEWLNLLIDLGEKVGDGVEVGLSQIMVSERTVTIRSGPLKSMEEKIQKIDLHKRIAKVGIEFMGREIVIYLGIEIIKETGKHR